MTKAWIVRDLAAEVRKTLQEVDPPVAERMDRVRWEAARKAFERAAALMNEIEQEMGQPPANVAAADGWAMKAKTPSERDTFLAEVIGPELARKILDAAAQANLTVAIAERTTAGSNPAQPYVDQLRQLGQQPSQAQVREVEKALEASGANPFTAPAGPYVHDLLTKGAVQG